MYVQPQRDIQHFRFLSREEVQDLKYQGWMCSICQTSDTSNPLIGHCKGHYFHRDCQVNWLRKQEKKIPKPEEILCSDCRNPCEYSSVISWNEWMIDQIPGVQELANRVCACFSYTSIQLISLGGIINVGGLVLSNPIFSLLGMLVQVIGINLAENDFSIKALPFQNLQNEFQNRIDFLQEKSIRILNEIATETNQLNKEIELRSKTEWFSRNVPESIELLNNTQETIDQLEKSIEQKTEESNQICITLKDLIDKFERLKNNTNLNQDLFYYQTLKLAKFIFPMGEVCMLIILYKNYLKSTGFF